MSEEEHINNEQVNGEEQNGSPSKRNKNKSNEEEHKSAEQEPQSENGNAPLVEPNLFTLVVHAILELDREGGARFDAIWKFIKSHFGLENDRRKLVRATVDESLESGELVEEGNKIRVNFAKKTDEAEQEEVPEEEAVVDKKKRRTKRPAMKKGAQEEEEEQPEEPETPRRGRKRTREASPSPSAGVSPKKRGRPAKVAKTEKTADVTDTPRRRGRPAKNKAESREVEEVASEVAEEVVEETPRRRGRPSKKGKSPKRGASPAKAKASPKKTSPHKTSPRKASPNKKTPNKTKSTPSKKSPSKRGASPSKGDLTLPKGWRVEEVVRQGGRTKDRADTYWYSPEGVKFRSRVAVLRHLEEQQ